jgi:hypothetical protein
LCPLMTISSPSRRMEVLMFVASDEATGTSVSVTGTCRAFINERHTASFSHAKRRPDLAVHKRDEPFLFLFGGTVASKDLYSHGARSIKPGLINKMRLLTHVASVRSRAVHSLARDVSSPSHDLSHNSILETQKTWSDKRQQEMIHLSAPRH